MSLQVDGAGAAIVAGAIIALCVMSRWTVNEAPYSWVQQMCHTAIVRTSWIVAFASFFMVGFSMNAGVYYTAAMQLCRCVMNACVAAWLRGKTDISAHQHTWVCLPVHVVSACISIWGPVYAEDRVYFHRSICLAACFWRIYAPLHSCRFASCVVELILCTVMEMFAIMVSLRHFNEADILPRLLIGHLLLSVLGLGWSYMWCILFRTLHESLQQVKVEKEAISSILSMVSDAAFWLSADGDTVLESDKKLEAVLGGGVRGKCLSEYMPSEERVRLRKVFDLIGDVGQNSPVHLLSTTVLGPDLRPRAVDLFIVDRRFAFHIGVDGWLAAPGLQQAPSQRRGFLVGLRCAQAGNDESDMSSSCFEGMEDTGLPPDEMHADVGEAALLQAVQARRGAGSASVVSMPLVLEDKPMLFDSTSASAHGPLAARTAAQQHDDGGARPGRRAASSMCSSSVGSWHFKVKNSFLHMAQRRVERRRSHSAPPRYDKPLAEEPSACPIGAASNTTTQTPATSAAPTPAFARPLFPFSSRDRHPYHGQDHCHDHDFHGHHERRDDQPSPTPHRCSRDHRHHDQGDGDDDRRQQPPTSLRMAAQEHDDGPLPARRVAPSMCSSQHDDSVRPGRRAAPSVCSSSVGSLDFTVQNSFLTMVRRRVERHRSHSAPPRWDQLLAEEPHARLDTAMTATTAATTATRAAPAPAPARPPFLSLKRDHHPHHDQDHERHDHPPIHPKTEYADSLNHDHHDDNLHHEHTQNDDDHERHDQDRCDSADDHRQQPSASPRMEYWRDRDRDHHDHDHHDHGDHHDRHTPHSPPPPAPEDEVPSEVGTFLGGSVSGTSSSISRSSSVDAATVSLKCPDEAPGRFALKSTPTRAYLSDVLHIRLQGAKSYGSLFHGQGVCRICAFDEDQRGRACVNGVFCNRCHNQHNSVSNRKARRKHNRRSSIIQQGLVSGRTIRGSAPWSSWFSK